jgi:hypothetical protein
VPHGQRDVSLRTYSWLSGPEPLLFLPSSSSVVLTGLSGPQGLVRQEGLGKLKKFTSSGFKPGTLRIEQSVLTTKLPSDKTAKYSTIQEERAVIW